jgi:hypothetical protein
MDQPMKRTKTKSERAPKQTETRRSPDKLPRTLSSDELRVVTGGGDDDGWQQTGP